MPARASSPPPFSAAVPEDADGLNPYFRKISLDPGDRL